MKPFFAGELATRIGQQVEVALDERLIEGVLAAVSGDVIVVVETSTYGPGLALTIVIDQINFVRFPAATP